MWSAEADSAYTPRMRRRLLFVVALVPLAAAVSAHGCSSEPPFESACAWLADPENCFREFREDMLTTASKDCHFEGDAPTEVGADSANPKGVANGVFLKRAALDVCIINGGGSVVFDPPIDPTMYPLDPLATPPTYTIKLMRGDATECGVASYTSPHGFSITLDAPPDAGTTAVGQTDAAAPAATIDSDDKDGGVPYPYGTYAQVIGAGRDAYDVMCPSGEAHHFNLNEIVGPLAADGVTHVSGCSGFAAVNPQARLQIDPGGVDVNGAVSFAINFPPTSSAGAADTYLDQTHLHDAVSVQPDTVVYFNCAVPAAPESCLNGVKDLAETDVDCGGPQIPSLDPTAACPIRCTDGQMCQCNADCEGNAPCVANPDTGIRQCTSDATSAGQLRCGWTATASTGGGPDAGPADSGTDGG